MFDLPKPPGGSNNNTPEFEKLVRRLLRAQGISEAAIAELLQGHSITSEGAREIFPGLIIPGKERVYKNGKFEEIEPPEPDGVIHQE